MSNQGVKRPRMSCSSDTTDSDARKHQRPASGDTESRRNAGIEQTQENPDCSTIASDGRPDVERIDWNRICQLSSEFTAIQKTILFADKTEFIFDVFNAGVRVVHLFAPRGYGKSTFLDTIQTCMSIQMNEHNEAIPNREDSEIYKLFMSLELGKKHTEFVQQNCGLYPVIHLSFLDVRCDDKTCFQESLTSAVCEAFTDHHEYLVKLDTYKKWVWRNPKLLEESEEVETFLNYSLESRRNKLTINDVNEGLVKLAKLLHIHHQQKVVILLDECDTPIMKFVQEEGSNEIIKVAIRRVGDILKSTVKGEDTEQHIKLGVLTSCNRMPGRSFTWELNNIKEFYFLRGNKFSKLYGFTEEEVRKMMSDPELKSICDKAHINQFDAIRDMDAINNWYDGYRPLHDEETSIYCSYSLLHYTIKSIENNTPTLVPYWAEGGYLPTLDTLFEKKEIREPIQQLLDGDSYEIRVGKVTMKNILGLRDMMNAKDQLTRAQVDFFLQLLSDNGILNTIDENERKATLIIPNYENKMIIEHYCYTENLFKDVYRMKPENMETYINTLKFLLRQPGKEACRQFAKAVSMLYSGDTQMPASETEFNAHLFNLTRLHLLFSAQYNTPDESTEEFMEEEEPEPSPASKSPAGHNLDRKIKLKPALKCRSTRGRKKEFDILITFGTAGVIFELKYGAQSAQEALQQIDNKKYFKAFDKKEHTGVERKMYVGLHMDKKRKVTMCAWLNGLRGEIVQVSSDDKM